MTLRRDLGATACFASALMILSSASCTPDERTLGVGLRASAPGDAGSSESAAGNSNEGGASGSAGESEASTQAGESGAASSPVAGSGGGASSSSGAAGSTGAHTGGTSGVAGAAGAISGDFGGQGGSGIGPCGDGDHNGIDDCAESLVQNPSFDSNVTPWTSGEWNASNAGAASSSGSLLVVNDLPVIADTGFNLKAAEQCVQVTGDFMYRVAARVMIPPAQGAGFAGINLWIFANDGCQGTYVTGLSPALTQTTNAWTQLDAEFKMPTAARSMVVRLAATRPFAQEKLRVLFDDIVVKQQLP